MLEKLALLKMALCRAPALSSVSSAWRAVLLVSSETPIRILAASFPLVKVSPPIIWSRST